MLSSSGSRTRTYDIMINSHALLPTELWRIKLLSSKNSPYGIRTRVTAVKRRCLNPLTNGPYIFKMGTSGLEPPTSRLSGVRSNQLSYRPLTSKKRVTRIELATTAWKAVVLPLNYTRINNPKKWRETESNRRHMELQSIALPTELPSQILREQDLNLRPSGYEPDELPDCSTPR